MEFSVFDGDVTTLETDLLALGVRKGTGWSEAPGFAPLDKALGGLLTAVAEEEGFEAKDGQRVQLHTHGRVAPKRILLVGLGDGEPTDGRTLAARAARAARGLRLERLAVVDPVGSAAFVVQGAVLGTYRFERWKTADVPPNRLTTVQIVGAVAAPGELATADRVARAICGARDLVNEPPVEMTPTALAERARAIADAGGLECTILDKAALEAKGMRLILAVSAGSTEEPRLIHLVYRPDGAGADTPAVAIVGKGITFDAGGLCIKPTGHIEEMKMDMAGGAAVLAVMESLAVTRPDVIVHGIVPASENLLGGAAYKPGDVFRSYLGKTVEVLNTDAEGRLVLADALAYAVELGVAEIVDMATLTGAICVALGNDRAGVFGSTDAVADAVVDAAGRAGESVWRMPLDAGLKKQLKSEVADLKNVGKRWGGAITAALFLSEFVGKTPWVHIDLAGPAWAEKSSDHLETGGTGFGVATILEYLGAAGARLRQK